jgi:hypothetical protein
MFVFGGGYVGDVRMKDGKMHLCGEVQTSTIHPAENCLRPAVNLERIPQRSGGKWD